MPDVQDIDPAGDEVPLVQHPNDVESVQQHCCIPCFHCFCGSKRTADDVLDEWQSHYEHSGDEDDECDDRGESVQMLEGRARRKTCKRKRKGDTRVCMKTPFTRCIRGCQGYAHEISSSSSVLMCVMACIFGMLLIFMLAATIQWTMQSSSSSPHYNHVYEDLQFEPFYHMSEDILPGHAYGGTADDSGNRSITNVSNFTAAQARNGSSLQIPDPILFEGVNASNEERHAIQRLEERFILNDTRG